MNDDDAKAPLDDMGTLGDVQPLDNLFGEVFQLAEQISEQISDAEISERLNRVVRESWHMPSGQEPSARRERVQHSGEHVPASMMVPLELQAGFAADNLRRIIRLGSSESDCRQSSFAFTTDRAYRAEAQAITEIVAEVRQAAEAARQDAEHARQALLEVTKSREEAVRLLAEARKINEAAIEQAAAIISSAQKNARQLIRDAAGATGESTVRSPGWHESTLIVPDTDIVATADYDHLRQCNLVHVTMPPTSTPVGESRLVNYMTYEPYGNLMVVENRGHRLRFNLTKVGEMIAACNVDDLLDSADLDRPRAGPRRIKAHVHALRPGPEALKRPDPAQASTVADFLQMLAEFRAWSGNPSYRAIAARSGERFANSTLYTALQRTDLPRLDITLAIVVGCGGTEDDVRQWQTAWRLIQPQRPQSQDPERLFARKS